MVLQIIKLGMRQHGSYFSLAFIFSSSFTSGRCKDMRRPEAQNRVSYDSLQSGHSNRSLLSWRYSTCKLSPRSSSSHVVSANVWTVKIYCWCKSRDEAERNTMSSVISIYLSCSPYCPFLFGKNSPHAAPLSLMAIHFRIISWKKQDLPATFPLLRYKTMLNCVADLIIGIAYL